VGSRGETQQQRPLSPLGPYSSSSRIITLLTDFGTADYFVAATKAAVLTINPHALIVDVSHEVPPGDVESAAFTLLAVYKTFPQGTIHVAVVDPGVGSSRSPLLIRTAEQFFLGPDNGIFSYVCDRESEQEFFRLTKSTFFRQPVSNTFHGRDIFAPVAASLSLGVKPEEVGPILEEITRLDPLAPKLRKDGRLQARIIHIDRFGNCITNLTPQDLPLDEKSVKAGLSIKGKKIKSFRRFFSDEDSSGKKLFAIWGSAGFLEIAAQNSSAARMLKARRGDKVIVSMDGS
jgi:S-adenosylmethionine hydrolase